jgi:Outer membrane protein beta-barrel domain
VRARIVLPVAFLFAGALPLQAQKPGSLELGAFGLFTKFDSKLHFSDRLGIGARAGVYVYPNLAIEGDVTYTRTKTQGDLDVRRTPLHARVIYGIPATDKVTLLVGAGYLRNIFRANYRETNSGFGGLVGAQVGLAQQFRLRLDLTGDYVPTAESVSLPPQVAGVEKKKSNFHFGIQVGLSRVLHSGQEGGS